MNIDSIPYSVARDRFEGFQPSGKVAVCGVETLSTSRQSWVSTQDNVSSVIDLLQKGLFKSVRSS